MPSLAVDADTAALTLAVNAAKGRGYKCPECDASMIFKKGDDRIPHFAHSPDTACEYSGGEGEAHKTAKFVLANLLSTRAQIELRRKCCGCNKVSTVIDVEYKDGDRVTMEYTLPDGNRADVAVVGPEGVRYVFEVYMTHGTATNREEPWFEVRAEDVIQAHGSDPQYCITLDCIRTTDMCFGCSRKATARLARGQAELEREESEWAVGCKGYGTCLLQREYSVYVENRKCVHACKPVRCPTCPAMEPFCLLDCHGGTCYSCAIGAMA